MTTKKDDLETLIESKIRDAKLGIWHSWFKYFLSLGSVLIVIFGVAVPLWQIDKNSERVEQAIQNMERRFEILTQMQHRQPNLTFFVDGQKLEGTTVSYSNGKFQFPDFEVRNIGDAPATDIRVRLYLSRIGHRLRGNSKTWKKRPDLKNEEVGFPFMFLYNHFEKGGVQFTLTPGQFGGGAGGTERYGEVLSRLDPTESIRVRIGDIEFENLRDGETIVPALFEIYYGQPRPTSVPFKIVAVKNTEG